MLRHARRLVVLIIGATVVLTGVLMLFLPGPGMLIILGGLALLAVEFAWARHLLHRVRQGADEGLKKMKDMVS